MRHVVIETLRVTHINTQMHKRTSLHKALTSSVKFTMSSLSLTLKTLPPTPLPNKKKLDKDYIKVYNKIQIVICHIL